MNSDEAWEIVKRYSRVSDFAEDEMPLVEEALTHIYIEARNLYDEDHFYMWEADVEAGAYNLADYYEKVGKYELAIKYYQISIEHGCDFAQGRIENIKNRINR